MKKRLCKYENHTHTHTIYIYIYIYREREREREVMQEYYINVSAEAVP